MTRPFAASLRSAIGAAILAAVASPALAQSQDWSGQVTIYGWGAGVTGDFTPFTGAPTLSFEKSLSDVLEDLDAAFFATALARRGDLVLFGDLTYSAASRGGLTPLGPASGEVTMRSLTLAAGQHFDMGGGTGLDVMGGLRAWSIDGQVSVPAVGVDVAPGQEFVDPILALRALTPLSERWSLLGYMDIGGFGVGSDLTWQIAVTANYKASERVYVSAGWRHLYVDYADGGTRFEGAMSGPLIGVTLQF